MQAHLDPENKDGSPPSSAAPGNPGCGLRGLAPADGGQGHERAVDRGPERAGLPNAGHGSRARAAGWESEAVRVLFTESMA